MKAHLSRTSRPSPPISRPSHRTCVQSQQACVGRAHPSQAMCVGNTASLCVRVPIIARRYSYAAAVDRRLDIHLVLNAVYECGGAG